MVVLIAFDDGRLLLERQFRYRWTGCSGSSLPASWMRVSQASTAAQRELEERDGFQRRARWRTYAGASTTPSPMPMKRIEI